MILLFGGKKVPEFAIGIGKTIKDVIADGVTCYISKVSIFIVLFIVLLLNSCSLDCRTKYQSDIEKCNLFYGHEHKGNNVLLNCIGDAEYKYQACSDS